MALAHHIVLSCDHPRCETRFRVRLIAGPPNAELARQAALPFGWVSRPVPGMRGKRREYCAAHAALYPEDPVTTTVTTTQPAPPVTSTRRRAP